MQVAVVYPGPIGEGLGSLAVHGLLRKINAHPMAAAEPVFAANPNESSRSLTSGRPLSAFDLLLVSISFEQQWSTLPAMLVAAGLPALARARGAQDPLVVAGGVGVRLNPQPGLAFLDGIVPGDAECVLDEMIGRLFEARGDNRRALIEQLDAIDGVASHPSLKAPVVARLFDCGPPVAQLGACHNTPFAGMHLVETGRGCPAGCRFCALGFTRRPPVFYSIDQVLEAAGPGLARGERIGLVGASLGRHPQLAELTRRLSAAGADLSPASLDPAVLSSDAGRELIAAMARSGQRSITLAPEAGSDRLRRVINKPFALDAFIEAVRRLGEAGIVHLKLYAMYGLPHEREDDRRALVELIGSARQAMLAAHKKRGGTGRLSVSLNPFVPKPHTPFEGEPMAEQAVLRGLRDGVLSGLRKLGGVGVTGLSPRQALLQCLVDRSDERLAKVLVASQGRWPPPAGLLREHLPDAHALVHEAWPVDRPAPWRVVDVGVDSKLLVRERQRARAERVTGACKASRCESCQACVGFPDPPPADEIS